MKALLSAIQSRLVNGLTYVRKVAIIPDPDWPIDDVQHPYVTLADRGMSRDYDSDSRIETLTVRVTVYQVVLQEAASVMGVGSKKGVLDIIADAETVLWQWLPSEDYHDARMLAHAPTEIVIAADEFSARKSLDVVYKRQVVGE